MPEEWDGWRILEPVGGGASGTVFRACRMDDPEYRSAIKIIRIPEDSEQTDEMRKAGMTEEQIRNAFRWRMESILDGIRRMGRFRGLSHLVSIEDFRTEEQENGPGFTVMIRMEYLKPLPTYLTDKKLDEAEVLRMGIDLCRALEVLHGSGVIHQDIKPDNIFVNERLPGGVFYKLGDLDGLRDPSEIKDGTAVKGTPSYLAPEVPAGGKADERTDIYELGLTLYQIANEGRLPFLPKRQFPSHHDMEIAVQIRMNGTRLPQPAGVSEAFYQNLQKACAFQPEQRYQSALEMREAMEELLKARPEGGKTKRKTPKVTEKHLAEKAPGRRTAGKRRFLLAASGMLICMLILGAVLGNRSTESRERDPSEHTAETSNEIILNPLAEKIQAVNRTYTELGLMQEDGSCRVPVSMEKLSALTALEDWLEEQYPTWDRAMKDLKPAALQDQHLCVWEDPEKRQILEIEYNETGNEMIRCSVTLLMQDRANGWGASHIRTEESSWSLIWYPPLRTFIRADYSGDGLIRRITRGNKQYDAIETMPMIQGVEYIP